MSDLRDYVIANAYSLDVYDGYKILYGNNIQGYLIPVYTFTPLLWKQCVIISKNKYMGDISLHLSGKIIRSVWNANRTIFDTPYPCKYNKY